MARTRVGKREAFAIGGLLLLVSVAVTAAVAAGPNRAAFQPGELIVKYRDPLSAEEAGSVADSAGEEIQGAALGPAEPQVQNSVGAAEAKSGADREAQGRSSLARLNRRYDLRSVKALGAPTRPEEGAESPRGNAAHSRLTAGALPRSSTYLLRLDPAADLAEAIAAYKHDPNVVYAEPNYVGSLCYAPSDPFYASNQAGDLAIIGAEGAWDAQPGCGAGFQPVVAVIDSGIEAAHPDLDDALDLANSYNFADDNTEIFDDIGHGTRVAGIIAAEGNNAEGIAGIAFGCKIMSLDVTTSAGVITTADVASAIDHAVARGADIINMSLRFSGYSQTLGNACDAAAGAGVLLVAAAGNENQGDLPVYPASFDSVIGVGAVADDGQTRAPWSNYNHYQTDLVELVAPGETVFSTIPGSQYNGSYGSGTSYAAPMVSAVAALLKAAHPDQSGPALRAHLRDAARSVGGGFQPATGAGFGLLDAEAALQTPMVPKIVVQSVTVDDDPSYDADNDGDGFLDAGESARLIVSLTSEKAAATNVTATLSVNPSSAAVIGPIGDDTAFFGSVDHGGATSNAGDPFTTITVSPSAPAQTAFFDLSLAGDGGYADATTFTLEIENTYTPPTIIAADTTWTSDKTYVIEANTVVMPGATLTIEPGTTVRFDHLGGLEVRGAVDARGALGQEITFTSLDGLPGGGFEPQVTMPVGKFPWSVFVGDADNDGDNDIVTANWSEFYVSLIRWNGTGFDPQVAIGVGGQARSVFIGDADNDGDNDIVTANYDSSNSISLIRWNGWGFNSQVTMPVGSWPRSVFVADADNDGDNDIVTANAGSDNVSLIRWNGSGFDSQVTMPVGDGPTSVFVADADNDGDNDIVTANYYSGNVSLIRSNGSGFDSQVTMPVGSMPQSVFVADADNDGDNDIVTTSFSSDNVCLIRWNGSGFDSQVTMPVGDAPESVFVADADNDGDNDIVTTNHGSFDVSLIRWNGTGFDPQVTVAALVRGNNWVGPYSVFVADADNDGDNDIVVANNNQEYNGPHSVSLTRWNKDLAVYPTYAGVWVRDSAAAAMFSHCTFQFGPVADESVVSSLTDCAFDRTGGTYSLSSESGSAPIVRCEVRGNDGGDGIHAGTKALIDCVAEDCAGTGLQGGVLTGCAARRNGGAGMTGSSATNCAAQDNGAGGIVVSGAAAECLASGNNGWGVSASGDVQNTTASLNGNGIAGANVTDCVARDNLGVGIQAGVAATNCVAENNGGTGITGNSLTDCVVAGNGSGLSISGTALRCAVAQNTGDGISGGAADSCAVYGNAGAGLSSPASLLNSWVVSNRSHGVSSPGAVDSSEIRWNAGMGIVGKPGPSYSAISDSRIRNNAGSGVRNSGTIGGCDLYGNGGVSGYDYQESRPSSELAQVDLSGNFWGTATTLLMNAHPWGTYYNIPRIYDFVDNTSLCEAKYAGHLASGSPAAGPDDAAPAFLLSVEPDLANAVNVGWTAFTLVFSKTMDATPSSAVGVTFGREAPYTAHVVEPDPGWVATNTWRGVFSVQSDTGDGINTIRVANAVDSTGYRVPDDTAHTFLIDTTGAGAANNGLAVTEAPRQLRLTWSETNRPPTAQGYNVHRSLSGLPGSYAKVNESLLTAAGFTDRNLSPGTAYYYIVFLVDSDNNAVQWTPPFAGRTLDATPTPTATATPTATPEPTVAPTATPVYHEPNPQGKWYNAPFPAPGEFVAPGRAAPGGKVGFQVFASDDPGGKKIFGSWNLGADGTKAVFPVAATEAEMTGKLYTARLTLRNDSAATADLCPGYRVEYANAAFTHFGGVEVTTTDAAHAPRQGADYTISVAWEAPFGCLDMGDSGTLADWPLAAGPEDRDRRRYTLLFDLFHSQLADRGVFTLEEIVVQPIDLPTSPDSSTVYTNYPNWLKAVIPGDYFQEGTMAQTASSITIQTGSYNPQRHARFVGAFAPVASAVGVLNGNPACRSGKLVRLSIQAASVDAETTPMTRLFLHAYMSKTEGAYGQPDFQMTRNTVWFDIYGALEPFAKFITAWGGRGVIDPSQPNPGVPPEGAGTRLSTWAYSHEGYDEANDYFLPDVQVLSLNAYADGGSGWADDSGGVTFSDARIEIYP